MRAKHFLIKIIVFVLLMGMLNGAIPAQARQALNNPALNAPSAQVTAYDLIVAMNSLRVANGLPALIENPIVNAVSQATANTMAANLMSWHIGDVRGRLTAAGYGGGGTVWGTENFAVGKTLTLDQIMVVWADEAHMLPAVKPYYCHVGAGVATAANGMIYYVLQAAYVSGKACDNQGSVVITPAPGGGNPIQVIIPINKATPDAEGKVFHVVLFGQTLWSIAIAYQVTIADLETWNNISRSQPLQTGKRLLIPDKNTVGFATPTPKGGFMTSTPDADERIIHVVEAYQTLSIIAAAYKTSLDSILALNNLKAEWPLQIGQQLLIDPGKITPSPTPRPLTPIEKLTPASDGNYYHIVRSGETLTGIANLYKVPLADLMMWNNLTNGSIINPDQKLLLKVTPPPGTPTLTPEPPTATVTATPAPPTFTATPRHTATRINPTPTLPPEPTRRENMPVLLLGGVVLAIGVLLWITFARKKPGPPETFEESEENE